MQALVALAIEGCTESWKRDGSLRHRAIKWGEDSLWGSKSLLSLSKIPSSNAWTGDTSGAVSEFACISGFIGSICQSQYAKSQGLSWRSLWSALDILPVCLHEEQQGFIPTSWARMSGRSRLLSPQQRIWCPPFYPTDRPLNCKSWNGWRWYLMWNTGDARGRCMLGQGITGQWSSQFHTTWSSSALSFVLFHQKSLWNHSNIGT